MPENEVNELKLMGTFARRLEKTEGELQALAPDVRQRVEDYLYGKYGWFKRDSQPQQPAPEA